MKSLVTLLMIGMMFPITIHAQETNLSKLDSVKRNDYLVERAKEVVMNFGPGYHYACDTPEITGPFIFDEKDEYYSPKYKKERGKKYYKITFNVDRTKFFFSWGYAAQVSIWEKSGEPLSVGFGNGMGKYFLGRSYKTWVEMGIKEEDTIPYEESELLKRIHDEE